MINPVESGLDLFSAIVRDMFKIDYNYGIYKITKCCKSLAKITVI